MEKLKPKEIQKVVRSLVVGLSSADEIYESFIGEGETPPSVLRFYLAQKGEGKDSRYTFVGGKIKETESFPEASLREIHEEAGLRYLGIPRQTIIGEWKYLSPKSGSRGVLLTYNPVVPVNSTTEFIIGDPKISKIESLSLKELEQLIKTGEREDIFLENHLADVVSTRDAISILPEEAQARHQSMTKMLSWMSHLEEYLKKRFSEIIFTGDSPISRDEFVVRYQKELGRFMRRGLEVAIKAKPESSLEDEQRHDLIQALDSGYLGKDLLYFLPQIAKKGIDWEGIEMSTEAVKTFVDFMKTTFAQFLDQQQFSEKQYREFMLSKDINLEEKATQINTLNEVFVQKLRDIFGLADNDLEKVIGYIENFYKDLSNEMKIADPKLTQGLYQDFTLVNEVHNANLGALLSLFMGYDMKASSPQSEELIRFEAGRQLVLLLKGLNGLKHYKTETENLKAGRFQTAANSFFGPVIGETIVPLGGESQMRVRIRKWGDRKVIVDGKPTKSFTSYLRKSFEERVGDIGDFHSLSIVILENTDVEQANFLKEEFVEYLKSQYPSLLCLECGNPNYYGTNDYLQSQTKGEEKILCGKRTGSQGNRFVRTKLFLELGKERLELIVYPLYSTEGLNENYWGWLEKIIDDKDYVVRRLLAGKKGIPSMFALLLPPELYPYHYLDKLHSDYHR